jgi:hypothetical protein
MFIQGSADSSALSTISKAYPSANAAGNYLIAAAIVAEPFGGLTGMTISDTQGNTWVPLSGPAEESNALPGVWVCSSCAAGANTVTATYGYGAQRIALAIYEFSGLVSLDAQAVNESYSSAGFSTAVTAAGPGALVGISLFQGPAVSAPATTTSGYTTEFTDVEFPGTFLSFSFGLFTAVAGAAGSYSLTLPLGSNTYSYAYLYHLAFTASAALTAQTITFPPISNHLPADPPFTLAPTASSGLAVSLAVVSGPATIAGGTVTLTGTSGAVVIRATQPGNGTYDAAAPVDQSFTVLSAQTNYSDGVTSSVLLTGTPYPGPTQPAGDEILVTATRNNYPWVQFRIPPGGSKSNVVAGGALFALQQGTALNADLSNMTSGTPGLLVVME